MHQCGPCHGEQLTPCEGTDSSSEQSFACGRQNLHLFACASKDTLPCLGWQSHPDRHNAALNCIYTSDSCHHHAISRLLYYGDLTFNLHSPLLVHSSDQHPTHAPFAYYCHLIRTPERSIQIRHRQRQLTTTYFETRYCIAIAYNSAGARVSLPSIHNTARLRLRHLPKLYSHKADSESSITYKI